MVPFLHFVYFYLLRYFNYMHFSINAWHWTQVEPSHHFVFFYFMRYLTTVAFFLHLVYFYPALAKLFLSEQKGNLSITFAFFYLPNIHFLSHICLFVLDIKWNLSITCSTLPNMNLSGTCPALGSNSYLDFNLRNISLSHLI